MESYFGLWSLFSVWVAKSEQAVTTELTLPIIRFPILIVSICVCVCAVLSPEFLRSAHTKTEPAAVLSLVFLVFFVQV